MAILKPNGLKVAVLFCALALAGIAKADPYALPSPYVKELREAKKNLCRSTEEYIKTLKFLRESKDFGFREADSRKIAEQVSKSCDGATERFSQVLVLLKTVGMSDKKSLEMALEFSTVEPQVQKNFLEIFSKAFLTEFFDYEFPKAMQLAFELSKDYKGDPKKARNDFIKLVKFCKESENLDLPLNFCAGYAVYMAKLSQYFEDGVADVFLNLFRDLREKKELSLDVKTALQLSQDILKNGPLAPQNFFEAYTLATTDFELNREKAIEFSLRLAQKSFTGDKPPILQFTHPPNEEL